MTKIKDLIQSVIKQVLETSTVAKSFDGKSATTKKQMVIKAMCERGHAVLVDDLPRVEKELMSYFEEFKNSDYFNDFYSNDYFRFLDLRDKPDARVVVIGDIHCDFYALSAIMLKLSVSDYDYFEKAYFVFLGDYLDRGGAYFEPLLLLMDLKRILGDRMIMLRGNHELISYNEETQALESRVLPQESCPIMNEYCGENKEYLKAFGYFYKTLPTYVYLKAGGKNILLTHGAVPRQVFLDNFTFNTENGSIDFETRFLYEQQKEAQQRTSDDSLVSMNTMLVSNLLSTRNKILFDMIWGDPCSDPEKFQVLGRFQFGSKQFEAYAKRNNISLVFRSHEPVVSGYESFFDQRLYTIFSTGGDMNDQGGYGNINPAFAVIDNNGNYFIENSFIYKTELGSVMKMVYNPFSVELLDKNAVKKCSINDEFACSYETIGKIESIFAKLKEGFIVSEDEEEAEETSEADESAADNPKDTVDTVLETETKKEQNGEEKPAEASSETAPEKEKEVPKKAEKDPKGDKKE